MKMIGWQLIQNNNIICIYLRQLNYFSSTSTINFSVDSLKNNFVNENVSSKGCNLPGITADRVAWMLSCMKLR